MNENQIREVLVSKLRKSSAGESAAFISEMFIDQFSRRADLIMVGAKLAVFEIKSGRDSLDRLDGQLESYCRFFEQVTIVCAPKHVDGVESLASADIGIWSIADDGKISIVRLAKRLPKLSSEKWLSFLPVDQLKVLLRSQGESISGPRHELVYAALTMSTRHVRCFVLSYLQRRDARIKVLVDKEKKRARNVVPLNGEDHLTRFLKTISTGILPIPRTRTQTHPTMPSAAISRSAAFD